MVYTAAQDNYPASNATAVPNQARKCAAVVPSDTVALTPYAKALYIGVAGDVSLIPVGGTTAVIFKNHPIGYLPVQVQQVTSANTTATNIVALYDV